MSPLQRCRRNGRVPDFAMPNAWQDSTGDVARAPITVRHKTPLELPRADRGGNSPPPHPYKQQQMSWWCSGWELGSRSKGRWFDSRLGHYQVNQVNSAFHPSMVGKSSTSLHGWGLAGCVYLCWVTGNTVWSHTASVVPWLWDGVPRKSYVGLYFYLYTK